MSSRGNGSVLKSDAHIALVKAVLEDHIDALDAREDISRAERVHVGMLRRYVADLDVS